MAVFWRRALLEDIVLGVMFQLVVVVEEEEEEIVWRCCV
jgi:hypothetical protein